VPSVVRHPSLRSGRRIVMSSRGTKVPRDPSLALGATKKGARGDEEKVLVATFPAVSSRGTKVPRDPSLALGATKKGARGDKERGLGATKKGGSG